MDREAKWLLRLIVILIMAAFVGTVVSKLDRIPALMGIRVESAKDKELRETVEKLKKDTDAITQQLPIMVSAHNNMVAGLQTILTQQNREMTVIARAMSDYHGQKRWLKMTATAREELEAEAKKLMEDANKADEQVEKK